MVGRHCPWDQGSCHFKTTEDLILVELISTALDPGFTFCVVVVETKMIT